MAATAVHLERVPTNPCHQSIRPQMSLATVSKAHACSYSFLIFVNTWATAPQRHRSPVHPLSFWRLLFLLSPNSCRPCLFSCMSTLPPHLPWRHCGSGLKDTHIRWSVQPSPAAAATTPCTPCQSAGAPAPPTGHACLLPGFQHLPDTTVSCQLCLS